MTPERWRQVTDIFHAARARDTAHRDAFLATACRADPALRVEVDAMLAGHAEAGSFGDTPLSMPTRHLAPGAQLGPYRIEELIGVGGMGEVHRAHDTKLGRDVAIKVLPELFASDPERLARFEREARVLASINHPNIATIHGIERNGDVTALVLELIEGETLAGRLARGPMPLKEALPAAPQLVDALDPAPAPGVVHRYLTAA